MSIHTIRFVELHPAGKNGNSGIVWEGYCRVTGEHLFCLKLYYPSGKLADEAYWPELSVLRGLADEFINEPQLAEDYYGSGGVAITLAPRPAAQSHSLQLRIEV